MLVPGIEPLTLCTAAQCVDHLTKVSLEKFWQKIGGSIFLENGEKYGDLLSFLQFFWFQRAISMLLSRALVMGPIFSALVQPTLKPHKGLYHLLGPAHPKNLDFV